MAKKNKKVTLKKENPPPVCSVTNQTADQSKAVTQEMIWYPQRGDSDEGIWG